MRIPRQRLPVDKDMNAVGSEGQDESIAEQFFAPAQIFEVAGRVAKEPEGGIVLGQPQTIEELRGDQTFASFLLDPLAGTGADSAADFAVGIMDNDQRPLPPCTGCCGATATS